MILRNISFRVEELLLKYPITAIVGPRQSGKTTLSQMIKPKYKYVNLENLSEREFAKTDPLAFLQKYSNGAIIDEIQNVPELFSYLQVVTDERKINGEYIITGSHNFLMMEQISQSLAGRVALFTLLPLSIKELKSTPYAKTKWEEYALSGFYPRRLTQNIPSSDYYDNYIKTYIERDVRLLKNITNLDLFQKFIQLLAGRTGQLYNQSSLGNELGIDNKTVNSWLNVLETSYITFRLKPYHTNFNKRIIKTPKIYFYDTGILCYLLGIYNTADLDLHFAKGSIFENLVIAELHKNSLNIGDKSKFYFWRDASGNEVDLITETGLRIDALEIKSGKTIQPSYFKGLNYIKNVIKNANLNLVYGGDDSQSRTNYEIKSVMDM